MIKNGDTVICETGVVGIVIKQYYPTACEQQTMIMCADGRKYHAPTRMFRLIKADCCENFSPKPMSLANFIEESSNFLKNN